MSGATLDVYTEQVQTSKTSGYGKFLVYSPPLKTVLVFSNQFDCLNLDHENALSIFSKNHIEYGATVLSNKTLVYVFKYLTTLSSAVFCHRLCGSFY
jgi:hypothetical protein